MGYLVEKGAVTAKTGWPLAPRDYPWSAGDAAKRIAAFLKISAPSAAYDQCCFWVADKSSTSWADRKLLFCDVVDGRIKAVPRAIMAAAFAGESDSAKSAVEAYYRRMADTFQDSSIKPPWVG